MKLTHDEQATLDAMKSNGYVDYMTEIDGDIQAGVNGLIEKGFDLRFAMMMDRSSKTYPRVTLVSEPKEKSA